MGFFIAILIILLLPLILPAIGRLIKRYAMGKMEDRMRRMMGMPTRSEEKKARKAREREERDTDGWSGSRQTEQESPRQGSRYSFRGRSRNHNVGNPAEDIRMMRLYAEDVEYIEIREYSAELRFEQDEPAGNIRITLEEQVTDAEFVVVK